MNQPTDVTRDEMPDGMDENGTPDPGSAATSESRVADLQARVDSLEDSLLRVKAESQNIQRRAAAERSEAIRFANAELIKALIPVLEDFDRTLAAADASDSSILEGTRLVHANLMKAMSDFGLEPIEAAGKAFDPSIHEALMHQPTDEIPPGQVLEQVTRGYRLRERVLRPARVIVSKAVDQGG